MTLSLFTSTITVGFFLFLAGLPWIFSPENSRVTLLGTLRNDLIELISLVAASAWFLWKVAHLGVSDFGEYRNWLFLFFGGVCTGSWFFCRDFIGVRAWAGFYLMFAAVILQSAFGFWEIPSRLLLVGCVYIGIVIALYFGALPYRLRDLLEWLQTRNRLMKALGSSLSLYGIILCVIAFLY
jgi:hypothetical protein